MKFVYHCLDKLAIYNENADLLLDHVSHVFFSDFATQVCLLNRERGFRGPGHFISGHRVSPLRVSNEPDHTEANRKFPPSNNVKDVPRFIDVMNFLFFCILVFYH
jgi:hypothetical protein